MLNALFQTIVFRARNSIVHERACYSLLDIIDEIGGFTQVIFIVCAFLLSPISKHSFFLKATKKLYKAKTNDNTIFGQSSTKLEKLTKSKSIKRHSHAKIMENAILANLKSKFNSHRDIKINFKQSLKLYIDNLIARFCWGCLICTCCRTKGVR